MAVAHFRSPEVGHESKNPKLSRDTLNMSLDFELSGVIEHLWRKVTQRVGPVMFLPGWGVSFLQSSRIFSQVGGCMGPELHLKSACDLCPGSVGL